MKKIVIAVIVVAVTALAVSAMADIGSQIGGAVKGEIKKEATKQVKGAVAGELNKDLAKYTCNYDKASKSYKDCNMKELAAKVVAERKVIEKTGSAAGSYTDYNLYIKTKNPDLYNAIHNELQNKYKVTTWDIWQDNKGTSNSASFYVKVE